MRDGTRINVKYSRKGAAGKPVVVLVHGDGQNHTVWKRIEAYFVSKGHAVLSYDLPGHGLSEPYKTPVLSFAAFAETLNEILEANNIRAPLIVGNSSGGMIAIEYAARHKTSGVVLISSTCQSPVKHTPSINQVIDAYLEKSAKSFVSQTLFDYNQLEKDDKTLSQAALRYTNPEGVRCNLEALRLFDASNQLKKIPAPVFAVRGERDQFVTEGCMTSIRQGIQKSKTVTIEGQGHNMLLQVPDLVLSAIESAYHFLEQE